MKRRASLEDLGPLSSSKRLINATQALETDIVLASERDIAFCIRMAQRRINIQRPCIIQVNSPNLGWQQAAIFDCCTDIVIVNDQTLVEPRRIYFISTFHVLDRKNNLFWIKKNNGTSPAFGEQVRQLVLDDKLSIGDLIILKNSQLRHLLIDLPHGINQIWFEGDVNSSPSIHPNAKTNSRSAIAKKLCHQGQGDKPSKGKPSDSEDSGQLSPIALEDNLLRYLHEHSQIDYQHFRQSWLVEHVQRRCSILGLKTVKSYLAHCETHEDEWKFFEQQVFTIKSNPKQFIGAVQNLRNIFSSEHLSQLINLSPGIRLWVPNSGVGEIAYGLALAWQEQDKNASIKIFATELSNERSAQAALGLHDDCVKTYDQPKFIEKYFGERKDLSQSLPGLRKQITFSYHDLLSSPGFSHIHIIYCHSTLFCYKEPAQRKILSTFNHSLVEGGLIWFSEYGFNDYETMGFEKLEDYPGFYKKIKTTPLPFDTSNTQTLKTYKRKHYAPPLRSLLDHHRRRNRYSEYHSALDLLIDKHMPSGLLVDSSGNLIHVLGNISEYVEPFHEGSFSVGVDKLLKAPLADRLAAALDKLLKQGRETQITLPWENGAEVTQLVVTFNYLQATENDAVYGAIFFEQEKAASFDTNIESSSMLDSHLRYIEKLEADLAILRENEEVDYKALQQENQDLHNVIADMAMANEQMGSINEGLIQNYDLMLYCYEQCRLALNYATRNNQTEELVPTIAIIDHKFNLQYFNDAMRYYLVDSNIKVGINFHQVANQLGGRDLVRTISDCLDNQRSANLKLATMISAQLISLPNNELMLSLIRPLRPDAPTLAKKKEQFEN